MKNLINTLVLLTLLAANAVEVSANPPPAYEGRRLYVSYCQVCHGVEVDGDGIMTNLMGIMPMDHTNPNVTNPLGNADLIRSILG